MKTSEIIQPEDIWEHYKKDNECLASIILERHSFYYNKRINMSKYDNINSFFEECALIIDTRDSIIKKERAKCYVYSKNCKKNTECELYRRIMTFNDAVKECYSSLKIPLKDFTNIVYDKFPMIISNRDRAKHKKELKKIQMSR